MYNGKVSSLVVYLLLVMCVSVNGAIRPETVPRRGVRNLDEASYVELAKQWKKYIGENGESCEALLNLGRAYDYSGEMDAAAAAGKRALELDPDNPRALAFYGNLLASWGDGNTPDVDGAIELYQRCRKLAPDYEYGLTGLATCYLRKGDLSNADAVFQTVFQQKTIPQPLQDYAYNMLVGLPEGAIIITHGDNDTFPPLALQAGMGFRKDVAVLNLSLLNLEKYSDAMFRRFPKIKPEGKLERNEYEPRHKDVIKVLLNQKKAPVYFVSAINFDYVGETPELFLEGFNLRTAKEGLSAEESAELLLETYRMDSSTNWNFAWSLAPNLREMMKNYVTAMTRLSEYMGLESGTKDDLLNEAKTISEFHSFDKLTAYIHKSMSN